MPFKIKDLMISDLSRGVADPIPARTCHPVTALFCGLITLELWTIWTILTPINTGPWGDITEPQKPTAASVAALSALKQQLQRQLAAVEKQESAAEEQLLPQTIEEIDALTGKLNEALEALRARRAALSGQETGKAGPGDAKSKG
jgi:hypothetical protein